MGPGTVRDQEQEEQDMWCQKDMAQGSAWQFTRKGIEDEALHPPEWPTCSNLFQQQNWRLPIAAGLSVKP